jgi:hypothetical protein
MKKQAFFFSATIVMALAVSPTQATTVATVSTSTAYQTILDSDSDTSYLIGTPATTESLSEHPDYPYSSWPANYAISNAWTTIGGAVKVFCEVQGGDVVSPSPPADMESVVASASASHTSDWLIASDTLAPGTQVLALLNVTFTGELRGQQAGAPETSAIASLAIDDIILYEAGGYRLRGYSVESSGEWVGDFDSSGFLDSSDMISFDAVVGQTIILTLSLEAEAYIPQAWEAGATVDFSNSGFYTFIGAQDPGTGNPLDVQFEIVPEPTALLLLGLGTLGLIRKSRQ